MLKMAAVLELRDLVKHYPGHKAVNGVSLAIPHGGFYSLLGPSGCGKTTTLRLIAGFETPTSGEVLLGGEPVNGRKPYERNVSTVFQNYALFPHLTVFENVAFGLRRKRATDIERRVKRALELVRLPGKERRYPGELSGGERQRTALARSLVLEPAVLLLDEPLSALDPQLRKDVRVELKTLQRELGITFVFVTHDQEEALSLSGAIAVMNAGRIEQAGSPEDLYQRPGSRFVAGFLGAVNWFEEAAVRPEATQISREVPNSGSPPLKALVTGVEYLGDRLHVHLKTQTGGRAMARAACAEPYRAGDEVYVWWRPADQLPVGAAPVQRALAGPSGR
jgi:ABC-type Fe3+/spermidine/putrescine transport system ATPase subunit